jgi:hypothetical protein
MNTPNVAIVILNWNGEKLLPKFLPSVIEHSQLPGVEVIVADNCSDDHSIDLLQRQFPEVRLLQLDRNYGFAEGYNQALREIDADYYVLLNSDVEVTPNWIEPAISLMDQDKTIAAVQPKILSYHRKTHFEYAGAAGGFIDRFGYPLCRGRVFDVLEEDKGQYNDRVDIFWGSGACLFIRAGLFHKAGGFDAGFWAHMEEIDLCWRLKNMGFRIIYSPDSVVYHLGGGSLPYDNPRKLYLNFRNNLWLLYKNLPARELFPVLFIRMVLDAVAAFKLLAEGNLNGIKSVLKAHYHFYRSLRKMHAKRKQFSTIGKFGHHPEMLRKSVVFQYYIRKRRTFSEF